MLTNSPYTTEKKRFSQEVMIDGVGYDGVPKNRTLREQVSYDLSALSTKHRTRIGTSNTRYLLTPHHSTTRKAPVILREIHSAESTSLP